MKRPVLIGSDNPYSNAPTDALSPRFPNSTGHRLWKILYNRLAIGFSDYERVFQRTNITDLPIMETSSGKVLTPDGLVRTMRGSTVVLLGDNVRRAFGLPKILLHPMVVEGVTYRQVPHPSGRCRWYNVPAQRELVGMLLEDLYLEYVNHRRG